jgi:hypothetical protein
MSYKNGKLISAHLNVESLPFLTGHVVGRTVRCFCVMNEQVSGSGAVLLVFCV